MAKYLVKNSDEYRLVTIGRLRWTPGRQMWVSDEVFSLQKVQALISSGIFQVLQTEGLIEPEVVEPEPEEVIEPEPPVEVPVPVKLEVAPPSKPSRSSLTALKVAELRVLASDAGIPWTGLRKQQLIDALLAEGEE